MTPLFSVRDRQAVLCLLSQGYLLAAMRILLEHIEWQHDHEHGGLCCPFCGYCTDDGHEGICMLRVALATLPPVPDRLREPGFGTYGYHGAGLGARIRELERLLDDPLCPQQLALRTELTALKAAAAIDARGGMASWGAES